MLETVRAYGLERLAEAREETQVRDALAAYYLVFVLGWMRILADWDIHISYPAALRAESGRAFQPHRT